MIKRGISYDNTIYTVENLLGVTNTIDKYDEYSLQYIIPLYSDTLKYSLFYLGVKISDLPTVRSKRSWWRPQGGGVRISPKGENE